METAFKNKVAILADFWLNYRFEEEFLDFVAYNDLGLPLSFLLEQNVVSETEKAVELVTETFRLLLALFEIADHGYEGLDELMATEE